MSPRPCIDCGVLTFSTRCALCKRARNQQRDAARGSRHERGYGTAWDALSKAIIERDGGVCHWCGGSATTTDHVIAKVHGGTDDPGNLVAACGRCNSARGGMVGT